MRFLRRTLPEDEFWQLIATLRGSADDEAVGRLADELRAGGGRRAAAFAERLAAVLYELDREVLFRQPVRWTDDPDDAEPVPLSGDTFLFLRAAVVAQGRAVVDEVLADPTALLRRRWADAEALLYAAGADVRTKYSYETGSNAAHWSPEDPDLSDHPVPVVAVLLSDLTAPIEAYADEAMTTPVDPPFHAWPLWFPMDVLEAVNDRVNSLVGEAGGIPASLEAEQIQICVGMGDSWQVVPDVEGKAMDDTGLGQVVRAEVRMRQDQVRAWNSADRRAALLALVASCCLAVLPDDHGSRPALRDAVAAGTHLLPAS